MVTPDDVAVDQGRPLTPDLAERWQMWIDQFERAIQRRARRCGVEYDSLDPDTVDDVILWAMRRRTAGLDDGAVSVTEQGSVDDASASDTRRYPEAQTDAFIRDSWWTELGLCTDSSTSDWVGSVPYQR